MRPSRRGCTWRSSELGSEGGMGTVRCHVHPSHTATSRVTFSSITSIRLLQMEPSGISPVQI